MVGTMAQAATETPECLGPASAGPLLCPLGVTRGQEYSTRRPTIGDSVGDGA